MILALLCGTSYSQDYFKQNMGGGNSFASDANGRPMYQITEYKAEGSPYFYEEYCLAEITSMRGKVYTDVKIKLNIQDNLVLYMLDDGKEMIASTPLQKIKFYATIQAGIAHGETILQSINTSINVQGAPVYQLLVDGPARLYKQITVTYNDNKGYGESTITRVFTKNEKLYALIPGDNSSLQKIEKNKTTIAALFGSKKDQVISYIEKQKLDYKKESGLAEIFRFYNSL